MSEPLPPPLSPSQKLRAYFKVPSADLERLLLEVEDTEEKLRQSIFNEARAIGLAKNDEALKQLADK